MKLALSLLAFTALLYAQTYEGCAQTKKDALIELSGTIKSNVQNNFEQSVVSTNSEENVQTNISSYINTSTNLSLVNITYKRKNENEVCASVDKEDQTKNAKKLLEKALLFKEQNLPSDIDAKIQKLDEWLKDIRQLSFLLPVFVENSKESQDILNKKEKLFKDLYTSSLAKSESLVFKGCGATKEEAKEKLDELLFSGATTQEEKGFFAALTSAFTSKDTKLINLFDTQITYAKKENQECAIIKKDDLFEIAQKMNNNVKRFTLKSLDKDPQKKYKQIQNYLKHLNITKSLLDVFANKFSSADFNRITNLKKSLEDLLAKTYPQYVVFNVKGEQGIKIKLDDKFVDNNVKHYIPEGEHSYLLSTKGKCSISDTFSLDKFEDESISEDFSSQDYPTVIFVSDKSPNIVVNGKNVKANVVTPIPKCEGSVRYIVKFDGQTKTGELDLGPGKTHQVDLEFLTAKELAIFNDAKTKYFKVPSGVKFSESLTPLASKKLVFSLKEDVEHGKLELHEQGSFKYIPDEGYVGMDSFEYVIEANDETSAPKVVNITVTKSNIVPPQDKNTTKPLKEKIIAKVQDANKTLQEVKKEVVEKVDDAKEEVEKKLQEAEAKYQRFKAYVMSQELSKEKMEKLQKKYPELFRKLVKEMTSE